VGQTLVLLILFWVFTFHVLLAMGLTFGDVAKGTEWPDLGQMDIAELLKKLASMKRDGRVCMYKSSRKTFRALNIGGAAFAIYRRGTCQRSQM
jgi:hypothetical protein